MTKNKFYWKVGEFAVDSYSKLGLNQDNWASSEDYVYANCPKRLWDCNFNELLAKLADENDIKKLIDFYQNLDKMILDGRGLYVSGASGVGKSTILTQIIKKSSGFYFDSLELISAIKRSWRDSTLSNFLEFIINEAPILAIDDFGRFDYKKEDEDKFYYMEIFTRRYNDKKTTIFASNHKLEYFKDEALLSRFQDYLQIHLIGNDLRGEND